MNELPESKNDSSDRWTLIRDIAVLQVKLVVDGLRDLILVPASLVAGIVSLASVKDGRPGDQFYQLIGMGKQSERWINLFGALQNAPPELRHFQEFPEADIDALVGRLETFVVDEHRKGGITAQAKARLDKVIDALGRGPDT
ncbi:MAG: hypothetical protein KJO01_00150 [Gammaproteobacteria bacterium]|nr:hypothetical protein [Gammaproteobacteria bacterium]MBT8109550.1 hypothetical protein [Gammaproteobacteria bacterium]NND46143.1 hypothetical protein [Woeseiaceae bacterium]NNL44252.1 hypothetical protein [Woeseiaceae bacterium]